MFFDPTLPKLNQVHTKIFHPESIFDQLSLIIEYNKKIPSATKPPNTNTLSHKLMEGFMYLQDKPYTPQSDEPSGDYIDKVQSINCQVHCSSTPTLYPGSKPTLLDHNFAGYLFLCLIDAHGKTSFLGFHQVSLDLGQIELPQTYWEDAP